MSDALNAIRAHIKEHGSVPTSFGEVVVEKTLLGQGGNGLVYPVDFEGPAVIKFLAETLSDKPSTKYKRFQREYRRLVRIPTHPNLVRLFHYDIISLGDLKIPAIVMERCAKSLKTHVLELNDKRLPVDELRKLCRQMCSVIDHIHQHGVIHRDIKPENILVRDDGSFVLADFGIARFDPELFPGTDLTKKGDRMANFAFSAPEQFEKDAVITTSADVFALGQVLYWCGTQATFRGATPPRMASVDESYAPFDEVVLSMSRQQAAARIQNGKGVMDALHGDEEHRREQEWHKHVIDSLFAFEAVLRKCAPGNRGIAHFTNKADIDRLFTALAGICKPNELWWTQGNANDAIRTMSRDEDGTWVLDGTEYNVTDCWVSRDSGLDRCFVLMRSEAMPSFGIYGDHEYDDEMVGLVDGKYISANEHDDGFARIDGEIVEVSGRSQLRQRFMRPNYCFIATKFNSVLVQQADRILDALIKAYHAGKSVDEQELRELWKLPKHPVSQMHD
ncbi:MAG: serine/threonine-protein kinase [Planctomycetaceae bacterium]